ncbi:arylamine N-acetyltransferase [Kribbella sandramycini]|uniref:Arylamine N-acetyltransferase n=1 Tax=Kribbella sandramycini TaxID=60450 RepID=A0A7Y4KWT6_9ACTN|nr:arylamine N-acetyltransferase [Kribbella sandramycini]MBB6567268.1 arylamine N-acetyltransferase [Kribbella sandramycini]NOL40118.1 arylamine N-acetyltransferase [Kribbella sandramycini]
MDSGALLRRIGFQDDGPPRVEALSRLHAAYVDQIPYESIQFQLMPGGPLDLDETARRIVERESGGYCFQLNGVLARLLTELGYRATMHAGGVETKTRPGDVDGTHLVLTVTGLVDDPERAWLVDAGLSGGLLHPIPLEAGSMRQEPFDLRLRRSVKTDGWRLDHDARASIVGMDFAAEPVTFERFAAQHAVLSTVPEAGFVRTAFAFRRKPKSLLTLRSLSFTETFADRTDAVVINSRADYFTLLADEFHLPFPQYDVSRRAQLWRQVCQQYEDFLTRP